MLEPPLDQVEEGKVVCKHDDLLRLLSSLFDKAKGCEQGGGIQARHWVINNHDGLFQLASVIFE